jgi:hypothetical protein
MRPVTATAEGTPRELTRRGAIRLAGAAGLAAAAGAVLAAAPASPAQASQDWWRWCRLCQGLWFGFNNTPGVCPARATGHSYTGSGNYTLATSQDTFALGQIGWYWCCRCQGLWYSANRSISACPAGPGGHEYAGSGDYVLEVNSGSGQGQWRWCHQCQGLWFGANGTGGVCPAPGTAGHSLAGSGNYHLDVD